MTEKEMMLFAYQQSPEPMIKNKVLRDALDKDLGPRNNFGDGGVTLITQGKNKGKYHLRLGSGKNRKTHIGTKDKLDLIFKNRKTAGGDVMSRLDKVKNPKGYLTQSQFQTFLKENNINAESSGSSFAKNHGVNTKVNPLQKNTLLYDTGQFTEEFIETVQKAQVKSGVGTKFARDKFPPKTKSELNKIRQAEIEAQGGIKKNSPFAGKKKLKVDLGHTGDYKTELVTGDKLAYTPSKVNSEMGKKGNLDDKIRAVKKKQNKALETLEGDDLKKILNETDATLTRLADQSSGFKSVVLSNGKKYGGDRLTIDPFNVYPGKTEVEIRDIQNKYSNKKIITTGPNKTSPAEIQKIQDAYFFEANRKSSLKAASKISKTQQKGIIKKLNDAGFTCSLAEGVDCDDPASYKKSVKEQMAKAANGDTKAISKIRTMGKLMNGFRGAAKFTGWTLLGEIGFAAPFAALDYAKGANNQEIISNATMGLFGKSEDEQLREKYSDFGQTQDLLDTYNKSIRQEEALNDQTGYGPIINPQNLENTNNKIKKLSKEFEEFLPPSMGFRGDFDLDLFYRRKAIDDQRIAEQAEEKKQIELDRNILTRSTGLEAVGLAQGGIMNIRKK